MMSTSSPRSCASSVLRTLALAAILVLPPRGGSAEEFPIESEGQLRFHVDASSFRAPEGKTELEIYATISNDQIRFREGADSTMGARITFRVSLRDEEDHEIFARATPLEPRAASTLDAEDRVILQALRESAVVDPGRYRLEVEVTDENALRTGLFNKMRRAHRAGRAESWVEARDHSGSEDLEASDLTLVRSARRVGTDVVFGRHGVDFDPNPQRFYGVALPVVRYYLEVYGGRGAGEQDTYFVQAQVLDQAGVPQAEQSLRAVGEDGLLVLTGEVPLSAGVNSGTHHLDVTVVRESDRLSVRKRGSFEVIWSVTSWGRDPERLVQEMALIMTDSERKTLEKLSAGAREVYLAEYWHELDPDPETPENEVLLAFRSRIAHADREFASTLNRGIESDRGRVFVRYGPPDDVVYEFSSAGFGLDGSTERVADPGERVALGARPSASFLEPDEFREGDVSSVAEQRGGANVKAKELQVWVYDGPGYPLTRHVGRGPNSHRGLKFIFADEMGDGNYSLIGSSGATIY